jgi:hypothetical protein
MTDTSGVLTSEILHATAPAPAPAPDPAPPSAPQQQYRPIGFPTTPSAFESPEAVAARAEIKEKIGSAEFYKELVSERERGVTGPATLRWSELHRLGFPSPTSIASQADVDAQAASRSAERINGYVNFLKRDIPDLTEQNEIELRNGYCSQASHDRPVRIKDSLIKDKAWFRRYEEGGAEERNLWARITAILAMRVVRP